MAHDVFISYAKQDKSTADAVCATLEQRAIRCWIAPRDVQPGAEWGSALIQAIKGSRVLVVVLSSAANASPHISREVERAVHQGIPIIPFRIEDVAPLGSLEFHLSAVHWLDAMTPPLEAHIEQLSRTVRALLNATGEHAGRAEASSPPPHGAPHTTYAQPNDPPPGRERPDDSWFGESAEAPVQPEPASVASSPVRDYRVLFDESRFGMNWSLALAYAAAIFINLFVVFSIWDAVKGSTSGGPGILEASAVFIATINGLALTVLLHRVRRPAWTAIGFALIAVVTAQLGQLIASLLSDGAPAFDPRYMPFRFLNALATCGGLIVGIRILGARLRGFFLVAALADAAIMIIVVPPLSQMIYGGSAVGLEWVLREVTGDVILGCLLWLACRRHLSRRGFRLTRSGAIVM